MISTDARYMKKRASTGASLVMHKRYLFSPRSVIVELGRLTSTPFRLAKDIIDDRLLGVRSEFLTADWGVR